MKELLRELCTLDGVPGYEDEVRAAIEKHVSPYADQMDTDPLGNLIVFKRGQKRRRRPLIFPVEHTDTLVLSGISITDLTASVRTSVVYDQKLKLLKGLLLHTLDCPSHIVFHPVNRHDH